MYNYAKHYKAVHVQDGECGAGPIESQIFQVNYAVCLNNKLYIIYADHTNIWVCPQVVLASQIPEQRRTAGDLNFIWPAACWSAQERT